MNSFPDPLSVAPREALSVSSLNRLAKSLLEDHFPNVLVEGEISNLSMPSSGHWYFTLKDEQAQIRCAMFRNRQVGMRFRPRDGMQVLLRGRLSLYEGRGDYQLIADALEEAGDGALRRRFEMLKQALSKEGLFDPQRKRPLPTPVRHIGVITSATGAVIRDIISVLGRRFPAIRVTLFPVPVQGAEAVSAICQAIALANRQGATLGLDVLIVARGGGSLEDLQAFNEEAVARAIAGSALPVVSAVGHETDVTIADFVADLRAPTPSAAAELLSPDQNDTLQMLESARQMLVRRMQATLQSATQQLHWLTTRLKHPGRRLQENAQTLDGLEARLLRAMRQHLRTLERHYLQQHQRLLRCSPHHTLGTWENHLDGLTQRLHRAMAQRLALAQQHFSHLTRHLDAVSPLNTLKRGYSISMSQDGAVVHSASHLQVGDSLLTVLAEGRVESVITARLAGHPFPSEKDISHD